MNEFFLHFVWQNQYFKKTDLKTVSNQALEIIKTGYSNKLAGPDFKEAYAVIGSIHWFGSVEIHVKSSDWFKHNHSGDPNYENVILHVVYEYDKPVYDSNGQEIPALELKGLIKPGLINRYEGLVSGQGFVPCAQSFKKVRSITKLSMLERSVVERVERKSLIVDQMLEHTRNDWEETAYGLFTESLGFKVNAENMALLAKTVPIKLLLKQQSVFQVEALLFGASGLLNIDFKDDYPNDLKKEYYFLKGKYGIQESLTFNQWHFSGTRPANFPTLRIAQLASFIHKHQNLFSLFTEFGDPHALKHAFNLEVSDYWMAHYNFQTKSERKLGKFTWSNVRHIIINVSVLLLVSLSKRNDEQSLLDKALNLLMSLSGEENTVISNWVDLGWNVSSAYDSQGLLELTNGYCNKKRCLECSIGTELITSS